MQDKIIELIVRILEVPEGTITKDTKIDDVEEWDSLAQVLIMGALEDELGIQISIEQAVEITSVKEILDYAER